jgi:hypothetical protein
LRDFVGEGGIGIAIVCLCRVLTVNTLMKYEFQERRKHIKIAVEGIKN